MKQRSFKKGLRAILPPNKVHKEKREELIREEMDKLIQKTLKEKKGQ